MNIVRNLPIAPKVIVKKLMDNGFTAHLVGGAVRDMLMGNEPKDYDIATSATPLEVKKIFEEYTVIPTGEKFGTVTVMIDDNGYEITTYRSDSSYSDGRHPDNISFSKTIEEDLIRRDLTINAIAIEMKFNEKIHGIGACITYSIIDPYNGISDIKNKIIRSVGNANERFNEDPLRIMRAVRFAYKYGFKIEGNTWIGILKCAHKLSYVSGERIQKELNQILEYYHDDNHITNKQSFIAILQMLDKAFIDMDGFDQNNPYHIFDLLEHTLKSVDAVKGDYRNKLIMLLHDVGKLSTKTTDEYGISHYIGHPEKSAEFAEEFLRRLKYSNDDIKYIKNMIMYHDKNIPYSSYSGLRRLMSKIGKDDVLNLILIKNADIFAQSFDKYETRKEELDIANEKINEIIEKDSALSIKDLAVNGKILMDELGIEEGPIIGKCLKEALDYVLCGENRNSKDKLLNFIKEFILC